MDKDPEIYGWHKFMPNPPQVGENEATIQAWMPSQTSEYLAQTGLTSLTNRGVIERNGKSVTILPDGTQEIRTVYCRYCGKEFRGLNGGTRGWGLNRWEHKVGKCVEDLEKELEELIPDALEAISVSGIDTQNKSEGYGES